MLLARPCAPCIWCSPGALTLICRSPLARPRAAAQIRAADLRFTAAEATSFFAQALGDEPLAEDRSAAAGTAHGRLDRRAATGRAGHASACRIALPLSRSLRGATAISWTTSRRFSSVNHCPSSTSCSRPRCFPDERRCLCCTHAGEPASQEMLECWSGTNSLSFRWMSSGSGIACMTCFVRRCWRVARDRARSGATLASAGGAVVCGTGRAARGDYARAGCGGLRLCRPLIEQAAGPFWFRGEAKTM